MLKSGEQVTWHPVRVKLSDDLTRQVTVLCDKSKGKTYFGGQRNPLKDTIAWIPFQSERHSGGIYVSCRTAEAPLTERELEFLTILGTISTGALDQIEKRKIEQPISAVVSEFHGLVGASKAMRDVYRQIELAAKAAATVLIEGESGTGKELVARAIHQCSSRAAGPFIAVDCGAIPEPLIESELFGAKKGSYTGAVADRPGLFEAAHKGTIFLDEISNTNPGIQAKLLRVLQEREVRRIGETKGRQIDVRLIAATNCNLDKLVHENRFRSDLLYRLKVLHIKIPALRSRREDIPMLVQIFLDRLNTANRTKKYFAAKLLQQLSAYNFPGNVRELQNVVERAFFSAKTSAITELPVESRPAEPPITDEVTIWFRELIEGQKNFWWVQDKYKKRDISREKVIALVDLGLKATQGSYKNLATRFQLRDKEYRRFMDFLRRNNCLLDFRPYRRAGFSP
jgi:transcriptional regulator with PAS, ATPase and Fis domain